METKFSFPNIRKKKFQSGGGRLCKRANHQGKIPKVSASRIPKVITSYSRVSQLQHHWQLKTDNSLLCRGVGWGGGMGWRGRESYDYRMFRSISGLYPMNASSIPYSLKLWQWTMSPDISKCLTGSKTASGWEPLMQVITEIDYNYQGVRWTESQHFGHSVHK